MGNVQSSIQKFANILSEWREVADKQLHYGFDELLAEMNDGDGYLDLGTEGIKNPNPPSSKISGSSRSNINKESKMFFRAASARDMANLPIVGGAKQG